MLGRAPFSGAAALLRNESDDFTIHVAFVEEHVVLDSHIIAAALESLAHVLA